MSGSDATWISAACISSSKMMWRVPVSGRLHCTYTFAQCYKGISWPAGQSLNISFKNLEASFNRKMKGLKKKMLV